MIIRSLIELRYSIYISSGDWVCYSTVESDLCGKYIELSKNPRNYGTTNELIKCVCST